VPLGTLQLPPSPQPVPHVTPAVTIVLLVLPTVSQLVPQGTLPQQPSLQLVPHVPRCLALHALFLPLHVSSVLSGMGSLLDQLELVKPSLVMRHVPLVKAQLLTVLLVIHIILLEIYQEPVRCNVTPAARHVLLQLLIIVLFVLLAIQALHQLQLLLPVLVV